MKKVFLTPITLKTYSWSFRIPEICFSISLQRTITIPHNSANKQYAFYHCVVQCCSDGRICIVLDHSNNFGWTTFLGPSMIWSEVSGHSNNRTRIIRVRVQCLNDYTNHGCCNVADSLWSMIFVLTAQHTHIK